MLEPSERCLPANLDTLSLVAKMTLHRVQPGQGKGGDLSSVSVRNLLDAKIKAPYGFDFPSLEPADCSLDEAFRVFCYAFGDDWSAARSNVNRWKSGIVQRLIAISRLDAFPPVLLEASSYIRLFGNSFFLRCPGCQVVLRSVMAYVSHGLITHLPNSEMRVARTSVSWKVGSRHVGVFSCVCCTPAKVYTQRSHLWRHMNKKHRMPRCSEALRL